MKSSTPVDGLSVNTTNQRDSGGHIFHEIQATTRHEQLAEQIADKVQAALMDEFGIKVPLMVSGTDIFFRPEPPHVTAVMQTVAEVAHQIQTK